LNNKTSFYLAGPIWNESSYKGEAKDWRKILTQELLDRKCQVIDPTLKISDEFQGESVQDVIDYRVKYGFSGESTMKFVDWIFYEDLRLIDKSSAIIAYLPKGITSFGTAQELFYNYYVLNKKNFVITNMNLIYDTSVFLQKTSIKFYESISSFLSNFTEVIQLINDD
jgi:hypothetical protein